MKKGQIALMIILVLLVLGLSGFIVYDKVLSNTIPEKTEQKKISKKKEKEEQEEKVEEPETEEETESKEATCTGVYYGEAKGTSANGLSYDYQYSYTLNADGTFTASFGGVSGTSGVFVINDNTVSFIGLKDVVGPKDEDPYYHTNDYVMADDCSNFKIPYSDFTMVLNRQ